MSQFDPKTIGVDTDEEFNSTVEVLVPSTNQKLVIMVNSESSIEEAISSLESDLNESVKIISPVHE